MNDERWTTNRTPSPTLPPREGGRGCEELPACHRTWSAGRRTPNSKAMTLVEVIAVMAIIGILAAIVLPKINFGTTSSSASVAGAANMIASDIRYAQEWAMANGVSKEIDFTSTSYSFNPSSPLDTTAKLFSGVTINTSNTSAFKFNSLGEPITGGGLFVTVSGGGVTKTITVVNYTGKVNIS